MAWLMLREGGMSARLSRPEWDDAEDAWVEHTRLVQALESIEAEILLHKWYESEKVGRDIGWDRAVVDWTVRHGHRLMPGK